MTATALLSLAEDHRILLHAPVTRLLPGLELSGEPGWSARLTPHLLMSHQGGIEDTVEVIGPTDDGALAAAFYDPVFLETVPLMVKPGTFYNYSNPNYMLAGLLAETAAGQPYRIVMQKRVFKPLGMTRAAYLASEVMADNDVASGMYFGQVLAPDAYDNAIARPAGFLWTSIDDLAKYMKFVMYGNRAVLSPHAWLNLHTPKINTRLNLDRHAYGYGLTFENGIALQDSSDQFRFYDGVKIVWHNGAIGGYQSLMVTLPNQQFGYAVLLNGDIDNPNAADMGACLQAAVRETVNDRLPAPSPFPDPQIQRDQFVDYVGHYSDRINLAGPAAITLTPLGNLRINFPALDAVGVSYDPILRPVNRDNFTLFLEGSAIRVTGFREGGSNIVHLRTRPTDFARTADTQTSLRTLAIPSVNVDALRKALRAAKMEATPLLPE
jgi:CubicO group peptidase (beta-lactamase class C family)